MNFNEFMQSFANDIGGQFSEYDKNKSVIVIPLDRGRFQAVLGIMKFSDRYMKTGIEFSSKVCPYHDKLNIKDLLEENSRFCHAKFVLDDDFIKVEASAFMDNVTESLLKEMVLEVGQTADEWELKLTGKDIH
ncbi:hypothetical protein QWY31_02585 [Cytophagales bacterium LB-30]|uniref:YbjN domain-containing protein n=1 Tax=Shiella aurantiaca TaxID=3058365 RepID=A0ABT8F246_9BACT|nr:hypothetical protein [Shiella aurantiaca]MDN4164369.1 hypothetical protein [Shiella aurantiaca]